MSAEQDEAAVGSVTAEERAELARLADTGERNWWSLDEADDVLGTVRPDTIRRLLADLDAAENIARLAEESEAGWRREADELAERLAAVRALAEPQLRSIPPDAFDAEATVEAFVAGRNWMIDRLRAALTTTPTPAAEVGRREESGR